MKNSTVNLKIDSHLSLKISAKIIHWIISLPLPSALPEGNSYTSIQQEGSYVSSFSILACWHSRSAAAAAVAGQLNFNPAAGAAGLSAAQLQQMIQPTSYITG